MTVKQIAKRINAHLARFERDPKINAPKDRGGLKLLDYYHAGAWAAGRWVHVQYISYHGADALTKAEAERYLAKLDASFIGRHYEALREDRP